MKYVIALVFALAASQAWAGSYCTTTCQEVAGANHCTTSCY